MKQVVSFDKLKLTNNQLDDNGHVSFPHFITFLGSLFRWKLVQTWLFLLRFTLLKIFMSGSRCMVCVYSVARTSHT